MKLYDLTLTKDDVFFLREILTEPIKTLEYSVKHLEQFKDNDIEHYEKKKNRLENLIQVRSRFPDDGIQDEVDKRRKSLYDAWHRDRHKHRYL